jgi:hypothetical protein
MYPGPLGAMNVLSNVVGAIPVASGIVPYRLKRVRQTSRHFSGGYGCFEIFQIHSAKEKVSMNFSR